MSEGPVSNCTPTDDKLPTDFQHPITEIMALWYKKHNSTLHKQIEVLKKDFLNQEGDHIERQRLLRRTQLELQHQSDLTDALLSGITEYCADVDRDTAGFLMEKLTYACRRNGLRLGDYIEDEDATEDDVTMETFLFEDSEE